METGTMGVVMVKALIENNRDLIAAEERRLAPEQVRRIEVADARVDTGATLIGLPLRMIEQLGLKRIRTVEAKTTAGLRSFGLYEPVKITIQGRDCEVRVSEVADNCPVRIGYIPLEQLDFVVDPRNQRLIGNPEHGGQFMIDMF